MKKRLFSACILGLSIVSNSLAGGLLTNTNQSIHFLRNPARDASTEIDAAYTNPAGLTKLINEGFHFSFNNQSAFQTRNIQSTFSPFVGFGESQTKLFKGEASVPFIPSLQGAYKKGKWVISGNFAISGGGGRATFNHGLASFEAPISLVPGGINKLGLALGAMYPGATLMTANQYAVDAYMEGASTIYGAQLGGSYAINELFSAHLGFRMNIVNNSYVGHIRDIMTNPISNNPAFGTGAMVPASAYFDKLSKIYGLPAPYVKKLDTLSMNTADKYLDCSQSGWGVTPILGINFNWNRLNIGIKYEFKTALSIENKTKVDDTGQFQDGVNTPHDVPALFTIGAQYGITPALTVSAGFHQFFDSDARMANDKQKHINGGTSEYLGGIEWRINKMFLISGGGQITRQGVTDAYQTDMSFSLNSYSIGFGGAVDISESIRINVGYFFTHYDDWTKKSENYNKTGLSGTDVFSRTNKVFGAGIDFRF